MRQHLNQISSTYGEFVSLNSYLISVDPNIIASIIKDISTGYDSTTKDNICSIPKTPDCEMIMFEFANNCSVTLRTSGTEPKIKYYTELAGKPGEHRNDLESKLASFVSNLVESMLQPTINKLERP